MGLKHADAPRRSWRAHLGVLAVVVLASVATFAISVFATMDLYPLCEANYSEDTIVAPKSYQGQLMCSIASDGDITDRVSILIAVLVLPILLALIGLAVWIRRRQVRPFMYLIVAALAFPCLAWTIVAVTPADCTEGQFSKYGESGCERNEEIRPGLNSY